MSDDNDNGASREHLAQHRREHTLWDKAFELRFSDHDNVHRLEGKALELQALEVERRLEGLNELRQQVVADRGAFVRRDILEARNKADDIAMGNIRDRIGSIEGRFLGIGLAAMALSAVAIIVSLVKP